MYLFFHWFVSRLWSFVSCLQCGCVKNIEMNLAVAVHRRTHHSNSKWHTQSHNFTNTCKVSATTSTAMIATEMFFFFPFDFQLRFSFRFPFSFCLKQNSRNDQPKLCCELSWRFWKRRTYTRRSKSKYSNIPFLICFHRKKEKKNERRM